MPSFRLRVRTGGGPLGGTGDVIAVTVLGTRGETPRTPLEGWGGPRCGARGDFSLSSPHPLGRPLLLRIHKGPRGPLPSSDWFLESVSLWEEGAEPPDDDADDLGRDVTEEPGGGGDDDDDSGSSDRTDGSADEDDEDDVDDVTEGEEESGDDVSDDVSEEEEEEEEPPEAACREEVTRKWEETWEAAAPYEADEEEEEEEEGEEGDDVTGEEVGGDVTEEEVPPGPFHFPCYRWLCGFGTWDIPEGRALPLPQRCPPLLRRHRRRHLRAQRRRFRLAPFAPGLPWALPLGTPPDPDLRYSPAKMAAFYLRGTAANLHSKLLGFLDRAQSWPSLEAMRGVLEPFQTEVTDYVVQHWQDEAFFGGQYLGGVNPLLLRRCSRLPPNFPVTPKMVAPALPPHSTLGTEMEAGNVYLADYGVLEGLPTAQLDGNPTFLAAPLVLLHLQPGGDLVPIAIQLSQHPGPRTPIFLPGDPPWVWALAKVWVRSAEFQVHEGLTHLLRCHLLGEVYALATLRNLPPQHPLYKLLIPHMRFTVHIATLARKFLLNPGGVFDSAVALGRRGLLQLVARGLRSLSYSSLVVPRDLRRRGVTRIPGYHYAHDALRIWRAIHSYVRGVLGLYYPGDSAVREDPELQAWVGEIFKKGFLGRRRSGVPSSLTSLPEAAIFVTMVIYSCSALHAATNSGQFELGAFIPNMPAAMREPPPQSKEPLGEEDFLRALPAMNTSAITLGVLWVLRNEPFDMRALGCYPENHFTEEAPRALIRRFRRRLAAISRSIQRRNQGLTLPYPYLDPRNIENSVAI